MIALGAVGCLILLINLETIMVFGAVTGKMNYSYLRVIQIGIIGSFERLEAIVVAIWVMGIFVKICVLLFIFCISLSEFVGIRNYREIITPTTLLSVIGSL